MIACPGGPATAPGGQSARTARPAPKPPVVAADDGSGGPDQHPTASVAPDRTPDGGVRGVDDGRAPPRRVGPQPRQARVGLHPLARRPVLGVHRRRPARAGGHPPGPPGNPVRHAAGRPRPVAGGNRALRPRGRRRHGLAHGLRHRGRHRRPPLPDPLGDARGWGFPGRSGPPGRTAGSGPRALDGSCRPSSPWRS